MATKQGQREESVKGVEGLRCYQLALELFEAVYKLAATMPDNGYIAFIRCQHQGREEFGAQVLHPDR